MYSLGKSKELLWESFVSNIDVCTTCSLKWAYEMHHKIHSQLSIHFTLGTTLAQLIFFSETVCPNFYGWHRRGKNKKTNFQSEWPKSWLKSNDLNINGRVYGIYKCFDNYYVKKCRDFASKTWVFQAVF